MPVTQVAFRTPKSCVKEKSRLSVTVSFRDRAAKAAVTPSNIWYRLYCLTSGTPLKEWTGVSPASSVTITVSPEENAIQFIGNRLEKKQLLIVADKDLDTQFTETFEYEVENVCGYP